LKGLSEVFWAQFSKFAPSPAPLLASSPVLREKRFMSWLVISLVVIFTIAYVVISLVFPEWVGMTGKKALEVQKHQRGDEEEKTE